MGSGPRSLMGPGWMTRGWVSLREGDIRMPAPKGNKNGLKHGLYAKKAVWTCPVFVDTINVATGVRTPLG